MRFIYIPILHGSYFKPYWDGKRHIYGRVGVLTAFLTSENKSAGSDCWNQSHEEKKSKNQLLQINANVHFGRLTTITSNLVKQRFYLSQLCTILSTSKLKIEKSMRKGRNNKEQNKSLTTIKITSLHMPDCEYHNSMLSVHFCKRFFKPLHSSVRFLCF